MGWLREKSKNQGPIGSDHTKCRSKTIFSETNNFLEKWIFKRLFLKKTIKREEKTSFYRPSFGNIVKSWQKNWVFTLKQDWTCCSLLRCRLRLNFLNSNNFALLSIADHWLKAMLKEMCKRHGMVDIQTNKNWVLLSISELCWALLNIAEDCWELPSIAEGTADHFLEDILKETGKRHEMGDKTEKQTITGS